MTVAYLRVSTTDQNTDKFKADILNFATNKKLGLPEFIEEKVSGRISWRERRIGAILDELDKGDSLIVPEFSRLARSMLQLHEILSVCREKGITLYSVKENLDTSDTSITTTAVIGFFSVMSQFESEIISQRTREGLRAARAAGVRMGRRPLSEGGKMSSQLDEHKEEIEAMLSRGSTVEFVRKYYGVHRSTLRDWMTRRGIDRQKLMDQTLTDLKRREKPEP